jgi:hypothetical protein
MLILSGIVVKTVKIVWVTCKSHHFWKKINYFSKFVIKI